MVKAEVEEPRDEIPLFGSGVTERRREETERRRDLVTEEFRDGGI